MADDVELFGYEAYAWGLKIVYAALALLVLLSATRSLAYLSQYRFLDQEAVTRVTAIVVAVALVAALFLAVFLYVSLHQVDVVVSTPVGGGQPIEPPPEPSPDVAGLYYLLPVVLLFAAGYLAGSREEDPLTAGANVVFGYAFAAVLTIVPVPWLFNNVVNEMLLNRPADAPVVTVYVPDPVSAHVVVALVYPLVFGGAGVVAHEAVSGGPSKAGDRRGKQPRSQEPPRDPTRDRPRDRAPRDDHRSPRNGGAQHRGRREPRNRDGEPPRDDRSRGRDRR